MKSIKKIMLISSIFVFMATLTACEKKEPKSQLVVANWGEYMDPEVLRDFEKETGIKIIYEEFDTNEAIYPKLELNTANYDLVCPSDYMIQKMLENDILQKINFTNIPNYKNIDERYIEKSKNFDPTGEYSIPHFWGTVGILYNKEMVTEPVDSWNILWNEKYKDSILMQSSIRDAFMVALARNKKSINSTDEAELIAARDELIRQKPLVHAYVIDQVRDKMIGEEAALGVIYSGEAITSKRANDKLEYIIPKEGSNFWIDSWVIPKTAKNTEAAEQFLNYLCKPEVALKNHEFVGYSTPNKAALALSEDIFRNETAVNPSDEELARCDTFKYLGAEKEAFYAKLYNEVLAAN